MLAAGFSTMIGTRFTTDALMMRRLARKVRFPKMTFCRRLADRQSCPQMAEGDRKTPPDAVDHVEHGHARKIPLMTPAWIHPTM